VKDAARWEIEISDAITGKLLVKGTRYQAGRFVTEDPYVADYFSKQQPRKYFRVRRLDKDEEAPEPVLYDVTVAPTAGPLSRLELIGGTPIPKDDTCKECGFAFKELNKHAKASGHDIRGFNKTKEESDGLSQTVPQATEA
jgi:hypothetical protein